MALDLSANSLGVPEVGGEKGPIMRSLKALLKGNIHLTHLDLSWNNIRKDMVRGGGPHTVVCDTDCAASISPQIGVVHVNYVLFVF